MRNWVRIGNTSKLATAVLLAAVLALCLACTQVWADSNVYSSTSGINLTQVGTCEVGGLQYQLFNKTLASENNDLDENQDAVKVATVSGYTSASAVSIPDSVSYEGVEYNVWMLGAATPVANAKTGTIGTWSFSALFEDDTKLNSVELPSGLYMIPESTFAGCTGLKAVMFREPAGGGQITCGSIQRNAFADCTALESITIPALENAQTTDTFLAGLASSETYGSQTQNGVGFSSYVFNHCNSLKEVVFEAGNGVGAYSYNFGYTLTTGNSALKSIVYKCKADPSVNEGIFSNIGVDTSSAGIYYAVDYYGSKEAAVADDGDCDGVPYCATRTERTHSKRLARVELKRGTPVSAIASGKVSAYMYTGANLSSFDSAGTSDGTVPDATSAYNAAHGTSLAAGSCVWKLECPVGEYIETLDDSYYAYPVPKSDLSEGSVVQDNLTVLRANFALVHAQHLSRDYWVADDPEGSRVYVKRGWGSATAYRVYMESGDSSGVETGAFIPVSSTGVPSVSDMKVYLPDGTQLDLSSCSIAYYNTSGAKATSQELAQGGAFEMRISSSQASGTLSQWVVTEAYSGSVVEIYTDNDSADQTARRMGAYAARYSSSSTQAAYGVIANSSNWRNSLIATSLAGVVEGYASLVEDSSVYNAFSNNFGTTPPNRVLIIGDSSEVSRETVDSLGNLSSTPSTVRLSSASTSLDCDDDPAVFAVAVYNYMKSHDGSGSGTNYTGGASYGDAAVLFSQDSCFDTSAATSFLYANKAAVFFTNADGSVSAETAAALKNFKTVYVAASAELVSDAVLASISGATRIAGADELSACQMSLELASTMLDAGASLSNVVVVDGSDPAYVASVAAVAGKLNGIVLTSCSTADSKAIAAYLRTHRDEVGCIYVIAPNGNAIQSGSFDFSTVLKSIWSSDFSSSALSIVAGDSFEYYGMGFKVTQASASGAGTAKFTGAFDTTHSLSGGVASCNGVSYAVTNTGASNTLAITYKGCGSATFATAAPTEFDPSVATKIPNPEREGYQFTGWTVRSNGAVIAEGVSDLVLEANTYTHAVDLTATWGSATDDLSYATVLGVEAYYDYTGKSVSPKPTVKLNGKILKVDVDYELSYSKNRDEGTAILYIDSLGSYTGTKKVEFEIVSDRIANKVTFKKSKVTKTYGATAFTNKMTQSAGLEATWASSDKRIATVNASGKVTVKKPGVCTITVKTASTASYKPATASYKLVVTPRATKVTKTTSVKKGFKVTVAKRAEATGYKLRYRVKGTSKWKVLTYAKNAPTTLVASKLAAKKAYEVQVCAYAKSSGGVAMSAWGATKTVKTK